MTAIQQSSRASVGTDSDRPGLLGFPRPVVVPDLEPLRVQTPAEIAADNLVFDLEILRIEVACLRAELRMQANDAAPHRFGRWASAQILAAWRIQGTISGAAKMLGANRNTVRHHLKSLGMLPATA